MKKIIITIATADILPQCKEIMDNHRAYAAANGYEHRLVTNIYWAHYPATVSKVWEIHHALVEEGYDIVLWADADVAFMNFKVDLADLLTPEYFIAAYQQTNWPKWAYLCAGLIALCIAGMPPDTALEQWHMDTLTRERNFNGIRCCNAAEIGCFSHDFWHDGTVWKPGMPTIHFAGHAPWDQRQKVFVEKYMRQVVR